MPLPRNETALHHLPAQGAPWALCGSAATRRLEAEALARHPPGALMARAGASLARLALALAPHARRVWVACGPGHNGGDGLVAALHLARQGRQVMVTRSAPAGAAAPDAQAAWAALREAGSREGLRVDWLEQPPTEAPDVALDALFGVGLRRPPDGAAAEAVAVLNRWRDLGVPVLSVDLPSGLDADTGQVHGSAVRASATLSLLTLKPGLLTALGRDVAGTLWFDPLDAPSAAAQRLGANDAPGPGDAPPGLMHPARAAGLRMPRPPSGHKGRYGDIRVVGGDTGMSGAAWLAGSAAAASGAGRVWVCLLDQAAARSLPTRLELMTAPYSADAPCRPGDTVVAGCGGGHAIAAALPALLRAAPRLVLDADALNAVAGDAGLRAALIARAGRGQPTVLTPHPLEAARLLGLDAAGVQADRVSHARRLAADLGAVVLLKGSGSVSAAPDGRAWINPTGDARLASAGTGDVLAGFLGGCWAQQAAAGMPMSLLDLVAAAAWWHGRAGDRTTGTSVAATDLVDALRADGAPPGSGGAQPDP